MDNWEKYQNMKEEELVDEMKLINTKLFKIREGSEIYNQLVNMRSMAQMAYEERLAIARLKTDKSPDILEIGNISGEVNEIIYKPNELLKVTVKSYFKTLRGKIKK
tara:strand:- start:461 stop:778 length:318 start_codon:yes stop_codon:yes gene_type:complete